MTHIEPFFGQQTVYRGFFTFVGTEVELVIETLDGKKIPSGKWPSFEAAVDAAVRLEPAPSVATETKADPFAPWVKKGFKLWVLQNSNTKKWMVLARKNNVLEDTLQQYDTEDEARKAAGLCA